MDRITVTAPKWEIGSCVAFLGISCGYMLYPIGIFLPVWMMAIVEKTADAALSMVICVIAYRAFRKIVFVPRIAKIECIKAPEDGWINTFTEGWVVGIDMSLVMLYISSTFCFIGSMTMTFDMLMQDAGLSFYARLPLAIIVFGICLLLVVVHDPPLVFMPVEDYEAWQRARDGSIV